MASCGSTGRPPDHDINKNRFCTAACSLSKTGCGKICMQQMSGEQLHRAQQLEQHPHQRQHALQDHRRRKGRPHIEEAEEEQQSAGQHDLLLTSQNESVNSISVSDCDSSYGWKEATAHRWRLPCCCAILFLVVLQGHLVALDGESSAAVVLAAEGRRSFSFPVLAAPLGEGTKAEGEGNSPASVADEGGQSSASPLLSSASTRKLQSTYTSTIVSSDELYEFSWHGSRILALGDLHGDLLNCMLLLCATGLLDPVTHSWSGGNALLIQTGDINDRGPQGVAVLDFFARLSTEARAAGGAVLQLMGNHDVMNLCGDFRYAHAAETAQLGGALGRRAAFNITRGRYGRMVFSFLAAANVNGVVFSHAGVLHDFGAWGLPALTRRLRVELINDCELSKKASLDIASSVRGAAGAAVTGVDGPLWTRSFSMGPMTKICEEVDQALRVLQAQKMVIGHTVQESGRIETYCGGTLIAIDTGISRYVSNQPKMLEIKDGNFIEWSIPPTRPGESVPAILKAASETAVTRPLGIPPLKKVTVSPAEQTMTTERRRERPEIPEGVKFTSDEL